MEHCVTLRKQTLQTKDIKSAILSASGIIMKTYMCFTHFL